MLENRVSCYERANSVFIFFNYYFPSIMKKIILFFVLSFPFFGFSQLWTFDSSNQDWTKKGSGAYSVATYGTTAGNLHLTVTGTTNNNNFIVLENLVQGIPAPVSNYKFLRVKLTNNSVVGTMTFRADATNPSGANKSVTITPNTTASAEYFIDLTGIIWPGTSPSTSTATPGSAGSFELRFQKAASDVWATTQYIAIDEIEFLTDIIKNDHTFDTLDNWAGETSGTNNSTVAVSGGMLIVTPGGGLNAKALNNFYSVDAASNKFVHIIYKNNSANNNRLRVNYFSPNDSYAALNSLPDQTIVTNGNSGEVVIDASAVAEWSGNIRKLSVIITNFDGTAINPANVDTGTFEIDRIVINNSNANLAVNEISNAKKTLQVVVVDNALHFGNAKVTKATIFNMNGQIAKDTKVSNNQVDVSTLKQGVYLVKAVSQDGSETITKFIRK